LATTAYRIGFEPHPPPRKERTLKLILALVVAAGLLGAARPATPTEDHSGVCVGSMQIVACVPPDGT
jgi:hypothetical protein